MLSRLQVMITARSLPDRGRYARPVAVAATMVVLLTAACGFDAQTNQPYTPAIGVNADVGGQAAGKGATVKIRNLLILSRSAGEGFLSASLVSNEQDVLEAVSGVPIKADGGEGSPLDVSFPDPIAVGNGSLVVLTDRAPIMVTSPDLEAGLTARLVLSFTTAGEVVMLVPVVDANQSEFSDVTPAPASSSALE